MHFGILAAALFSSTIGLMPSAVAQVIPQENDVQPRRVAGDREFHSHRTTPPRVDAVTVKCTVGKSYDKITKKQMGP